MNPDRERCQSCKHWKRDIDRDDGVCQLISGYAERPRDKIPKPLARPEPQTFSVQVPYDERITTVLLRTHSQFGCVQWEP